MLAELLSGVELRWGGWNVPQMFVLGLLVAVVLGLLYADKALTAAAAKKRPRGPGAVPAALIPKEQAGPVLAALSRISEKAAAPADPGADKRTSIRREGPSVDVLVSDPRSQAEPAPGVVLNRSRGGLLLSVGHPVEAGTLLRVRAAHAPEAIDWVPIEVRHCRSKGERYLLGCKFGEELPWSVLLLFG